MIQDYLELTKPRVNTLVVLTTLLGFFLGVYGGVDVVRLLALLIGTAFVAGGSSALNQYIERSSDAQMKRTSHRPLPQGRIEPGKAFSFGMVLSIIGFLILSFWVNLLTAFLAFMALVTYICFYTPLKSRTSLCTIVGAIPGAIPPMMGWTAIRNTISLEAWILFSILFLWQLPHFLSLAKIYRRDYAAAGLQMLPVLDEGGQMTARQIIFYTLVLIPVSLFPTFRGIAGPYYFFGALILGLVFLGLGCRCAFHLTQEAKIYSNYKSFFLASVIYLPILLTLLVVDKI